MTIEIANRLVEWRKQNRLSQEELAEKIGVSRQAVSKWERAESSPDTDNLIELARLYNISLDELLYTAEPVGGEIPETTQEPEAPEADTQADAQTAPDGEAVPAEPERAVISIGPAGIKIAPLRRRFMQNPKWRALWRVPVPLIVTAIYLLMGFCLHLWHPGWIIFYAIPSYYFCAAMHVVEGLRKKLFLFPITFVCLTVFFLLGFYGRLWHPAWVVFLLIPAYYSLVGTFFKK